MSALAKPNPTFISDDMEIISVFKGLMSTKEKVWIWQKTPMANGRRPVHFGVVKKVDAMKRVVEIRPNNSRGFKFTPGEDIFIYSSSRCLACKVALRESNADVVTFLMPKRMNILDPETLKGLALVEKDDEEKMRHLRQGGRKQAKNDQMVSVHRPSNKAHSVHLLHDISSGGMGFKIDDPAEYDIGEEVEVLGIDGKPLPKKIVGKVVAIRQMDDDLRTFKVGVKFNT